MDAYNSCHDIRPPLSLLNQSGTQSDARLGMGMNMDGRVGPQLGNLQEGEGKSERVGL